MPNIFNFPYFANRRNLHKGGEASAAATTTKAYISHVPSRPKASKTKGLPSNR